MAQLIDIRKVTVGPKYLTCLVRIGEDAPLTTDGDPEGTERVLGKLPEIRDHVCLGDAGATFGDGVEATELAHLFEHVSIELMARTGLAGAISSGRTRAAEEDRCYEVQLLCPDDVLTVGAISSAAFILDWAYSGGADPEPGIGAIVDGLVQIVESVSGDEEASAELIAEAVPEAEVEAAEAPAVDEAPAPVEPIFEEEPVLPVDDEEEAVDPGSTVMMSADQIKEAALVAEVEPEPEPAPAAPAERVPGSVTVIAPPTSAEPEPEAPATSVPQPIFTAGPSKEDGR